MIAQVAGSLVLKRFQELGFNEHTEHHCSGDKIRIAISVHTV